MSRLFESVVEHWIYNPAARIQIPPKSWNFSSLVCYSLSLLRLSCREMGTQSKIGLILRRNGFKVNINGDFLEEGEYYGR